MYRPLFRPQGGDPTTTLDWFNCTMSSGAMALDFHTLGKVQKWGGELRKLSGDVVGGTGIPELAKAWSRLGYTLTDRRGRSWGDLMVDLKSGHGVVLQGDYDMLGPGDTCQGSFDGDHAVYLNPEFFGSGTETEVAVGDPLCKGFHRVKVSVLKGYAEKLGRRQYGKDEPQPIFYAITRARPDPTPPPVILRFGAVRAKPFPDRTRIKSPVRGEKVNVRKGPGFTYTRETSLSDGTLWVAYQVKGRWFGNKTGTRWVHDSGLTHEGGVS